MFGYHCWRLMTSILVVDDEPKIRDAMTRLLQYKGYRVYAVDTGRAAVEQFRQAASDLVLLDIALPDMTGIEVLAELRERNSAVPCIFITAYGSVRSAVEAMRAGGFNYLTKPFDNDELLLTVERALDVSRLGQRVTIHFAILVDRQGLQMDEGLRNHIPWQLGLQHAAQIL